MRIGCSFVLRFARSKMMVTSAKLLQEISKYPLAKVSEMHSQESLNNQRDNEST